MPVTTYLETLDKYLAWKNAVELQVDELGHIVVEEHGGKIHYIEDERLDLDYFQGLARVISNELDILEFHKTPFLSTSIKGGHRLELNVGNFIAGKVAMSIRIWRPRMYFLDDYGLTDEQLLLMKRAVSEKWNILISGGMFSGKTTFANALAELFPTTDRVISIQDLPEFDLTHIKRRVEYFVNRLGTDNGIDHERALMSVTRMRPDRIVVNELNTDNTWTIAKLLNVGHGGTITTIHANDPASALDAMVTNIDSGPRSITNPKALFEQHIHLIIQVHKLPDYSRRVTAMRANPPYVVDFDGTPTIEWVRPDPKAS